MAKTYRICCPVPTAPHGFRCDEDLLVTVVDGCWDTLRVAPGTAPEHAAHVATLESGWHDADLNDAIDDAIAANIVER